MPDPFSTRRLECWLAKLEFVPPPPGFESLGDCALWQGAIDRHGYPRFWCPDFPAFSGGCKKGGSVLAHRWGVAYVFGPEAIEGLDGDHACRRTSCVMPWHVRPLPKGANVARGNMLRNLPVEAEDFIF